MIFFVVATEYDVVLKKECGERGRLISRGGSKRKGHHEIMRFGLHVRWIQCSIDTSSSSSSFVLSLRVPAQH